MGERSFNIRAPAPRASVAEAAHRPTGPFTDAPSPGAGGGRIIVVTGHARGPGAPASGHERATTRVLHTAPAVTTTPRFARVAFAAAGIYGLLVTVPLYWMEERIGRDTPPAITHPEYFYGFVGVVIAWQLAFLLVARDPARYRALMPVAVVEKLGFGLPALVLYARHRIAGSTLGFGVIDLVLAALFATSYVLTRPSRESASRVAARAAA